VTREELERHWAKSENWSGAGFYYCPEDPRVIVPKRRPTMGWTINFAHPLAVPVLLLAFLFPAVPIVLLVRYHIPVQWFIGALAICVCLLVLLSHLEATRSRE
jgi:uncharacterized membrane protein